MRALAASSSKASAPRRGGPGAAPDLAFRVRRRDDGARAGDVAREEQRHNARLNSDLKTTAATPTMSSGSTFPKTTSQTMSQTHTATSATAAR